MKLNGLFRFTRSVLRVIRSWWRVDRVRVSPAAGCLLRLRVGDVLNIRAQSAEILNRTQASPDSADVVYQCLTDSGTALLRIELQPNLREFAIVWIVQGASEALGEYDVQVWQHSPRSDN